MFVPRSVWRGSVAPLCRAILRRGFRSHKAGLLIGGSGSLIRRAGLMLDCREPQRKPAGTPPIWIMDKQDFKPDTRYTLACRDEGGRVRPLNL
jgi:hypothetical protein